MKKQKLWIYEYRDDDTPVGATLFDDFAENLDDSVSLPHLQEPWHWRIESSWEEVDDG